MYKSLNLGGAILTGMFLSGAVIADENVCRPVTAANSSTLPAVLTAPAANAWR